MERVGWDEVLDEIQTAIDDSFSDEAVFLALTDLLGGPVEDVKRLNFVGRFTLLEYTPVAATDPDIIIMVGHDGWAPAVNRAILALQRHREKRSLSGTEWYKIARRLLVHVEAALGKIDPSPAERRFVMSWATMVVVRYRLIPPNYIGAMM